MPPTSVPAHTATPDAKDVRASPGPAGEGADGSADQERPGHLEHPDRGHALGVAEPSDRGEEQDGRAVGHAREPDPHGGQITLRVMSTSAEPTPPGTTPEAEVVPPRRATHVFGIETEYGISALAPGSPALAGALSTGYVDDDLHPMQLSNHVVKAYGNSVAGQPAGWDYETETPLRDIRGYEISRSAAHPDQLTDSDLGMANVILTNGARLYVAQLNTSPLISVVTMPTGSTSWSVDVVKASG